MRHELYSVEVNENCVEIQGELTIEEAFDFLSFYERKGYNKLCPGQENSSMFLMKCPSEKSIPEENIFESMYEQERLECQSLMAHVKDLESTIQLLKDNQERDMKHVEILKNCIIDERKYFLESLKDITQKHDEYFKGFACKKNEKEELTEEFSIPEKQAAYEALLKLKNKGPHLHVPDPRD